jgi:hypothetical protein
VCGGEPAAVRRRAARAPRFRVMLLGHEPAQPRSTPAADPLRGAGPVAAAGRDSARAQELDVTATSSARRRGGAGFASASLPGQRLDVTRDPFATRTGWGGRSGRQTDRRGGDGTAERRGAPLDRSSQARHVRERPGRRGVGPPVAAAQTDHRPVRATAAEHPFRAMASCPRFTAWVVAHDIGRSARRVRVARRGSDTLRRRPGRTAGVAAGGWNVRPTAATGDAVEVVVRPRARGVRVHPRDGPSAVITCCGRVRRRAGGRAAPTRSAAQAAAGARDRLPLQRGAGRTQARPDCRPAAGGDPSAR